MISSRMSTLEGCNSEMIGGTGSFPIHQTCYLRGVEIRGLDDVDVRCGERGTYVNEAFLSGNHFQDRGHGSLMIFFEKVDKIRFESIQR